MEWILPLDDDLVKPCYKDAYFRGKIPGCKLQEDQLEEKYTVHQSWQLLLYEP